MPKLILFVDCSNFYHTLKGLKINPSTIDCNNFFEQITRQKNPVVRFYDAPKKAEDGMRQYANQQYFHAALRKNPNLTLHFGRLQRNKMLSAENTATVSKSLGFCDKCRSKISSLLSALGVLKRHKEKGVDVRIAVDLIALAESGEYDVAILLSGDSDLAPAAEHAVKRKGKKVINAYFDASGGKELRDACSSCFLIKPERLKQCLKSG